MDKFYLNQTEKDKLIAFNEDEIMRDAVKKVVLEGLYFYGMLEAGTPAVDKNWAYNLGGLNDFAMDNSKVGELLKATVKGIALVEDGFKRLEEFKREEPHVEEGVNPAA